MDPIEVTERLGRWSSGRGPLYVLLAGRLRQLIDDGELAAGAVLPPDRVFAKQLAVGRNTVIAAYDLLESEGRIVRRRGSGTRVAGGGAETASDTTSAPMFLNLLEPHPDVISLACAAPEAPPVEVTTAYADMVPVLAAMTAEIGYHPAGHPPLRAAIAERYTRLGAPTGPEHILVTNGGQQALSLLARALVRPGDRVLVETPTYPGALEAFHEEAALLTTLPIGFPGFEAALRTQRPALVYLTPTFQNPTGAVLSGLRRQRITEITAAQDVPLIADEITADLAFPGVATPPPLAAEADGVISIGSLSKNLWGGLRVGWIRAAEPVIARLTRLRAVHDLGGNLPAQLAATALVPCIDATSAARGHRLRAGHDLLRAKLAAALPEWELPPVTGGQTLWVRLPYGDGTSFAQTALRHGVAVLAGTGLDPGGGSEDRVRLHFRHPDAVLGAAVERLASAWRAYRPPAKRVAAPPPLAV
ncbi:aminotransferase class I/II-fold pyridoxal phosphate-dependent enzyme [Nocardia sp. ET3-3]|uniref:Aminotransferase class I/II-fold pyridoxal phosphate-dependent enzyme n=1 Tax=Nocardia terrae TaxID=2675851 RepID=A0A7K1UXA8_9NOCA|nr:PLP-dependent aminotransferase family protein [Nocardia terrae]MVU79016.1 aminotransferase class I/II-fold pyridoxal phosphate-dependent enzyme [Nocardia terrae]